MKKDKELSIKTLGKGVFEIDCFYLERKAYTACYLVEKDSEIAIIETNTNYAVPLILEAIKSLGYREEQVKYIIITHVHLDHAGGAGELMSQLSEAYLVAHPRGAGHMIHPEKLIASVKQVYGDEKYQQLYGNILPVPEERVVGIQDQDQLKLGKGGLLCVETPGHAKHHVAIFDGDSKTLFSGDAFGIGYPRFDFGQFRLIFPSTAPVQFDPDMAKMSFDKIIGLNPDRILLTHYGCIQDIKAAYYQLNKWIDDMVERAQKRFKEGKRDDTLSGTLTDDLWTYTETLIKKARGRGLNNDEKEFLSLDINLNAMGLTVYIQKKNH
ncbi:MAG: MBL fold metallo-hydrolase [Candidatus Aminicenantes bacterium]|nr:MBL fold metallo-hydrolase [Candidatus Aminicenantes bacterium]